MEKSSKEIEYYISNHNNPYEFKKLNENYKISVYYLIIFIYYKEIIN